MTYLDLSNKDTLNPQEMFEVKGGYECYSYGCESNVCNTNRAGAESSCSTAYCRSGMGPVKFERKKDCILFTEL